MQYDWSEWDFEPDEGDNEPTIILSSFDNDKYCFGCFSNRIYFDHTGHEMDMTDFAMTVRARFNLGLHPFVVLMANSCDWQSTLRYSVDQLPQVWSSVQFWCTILFILQLFYFVYCFYYKPKFAVPVSSLQAYETLIRHISNHPRQFSVSDLGTVGLFREQTRRAPSYYHTCKEWFKQTRGYIYWPVSIPFWTWFGPLWSILIINYLLNAQVDDLPENLFGYAVYLIITIVLAWPVLKKLDFVWHWAKQMFLLVIPLNATRDQRRTETWHLPSRPNSDRNRTNTASVQTDPVEIQNVPKSVRNVRVQSQSAQTDNVTIVSYVKLKEQEIQAVIKLKEKSCQSDGVQDQTVPNIEAVEKACQTIPKNPPAKKSNKCQTDVSFAESIKLCMKQYSHTCSQTDKYLEHRVATVAPFKEEEVLCSNEQDWQDVYEREWQAIIDGSTCTHVEQQQQQQLHVMHVGTDTEQTDGMDVVETLVNDSFIYERLLDLCPQVLHEFVMMTVFSCRPAARHCRNVDRTYQQLQYTDTHSSVDRFVQTEESPVDDLVDCLITDPTIFYHVMQQTNLKILYYKLAAVT